MTSDQTTARAAGQILAWYEAMGVDAAVQDEPVDWLQRGAKAPGADFAPITRQSPAAPSTPPAAGRAPSPAPRPGAREPRRFTGKPAPAAGDDARATAETLQK